MKRRFGDRYDGRRLRSLDAFSMITPYIMRERDDAQVYFEDRIDATEAEAWLRAQRDSGQAGLGYLHLFITALVRTISQKPALNRFIADRRIYARNDITISLAIKKRLRDDSPETTLRGYSWAFPVSSFASWSSS
jgi:2-oxoacid dehydrogenases acyltransferase (catalytic domain).